MQIETGKDHGIGRLFRFLSLANKYSVARSLQIEVISQLKMKGRVLDYGGGNLAKYRSMLKCDEYHSVNIDRNIEPTWKINPGDPIPCNSKEFDVAISFNTFEHIYDSVSVINELHRAIKDGGELHILTPFLYPVHGHPDDYFRPTKSWFIETLSSAGFRNINIHPLLWGPFSTGLSCTGTPGPLKKIRKFSSIMLDYLYWKLRTIYSKHIDYNEHLVNYPLSYYVHAIK